MTKVPINFIFTHVMTHSLFVCSKINDSFTLNTAYYYTLRSGCVYMYWLCDMVDCTILIATA